MIAALRQQFSRKRDRNRPPAAERGQVQPARDIGGGGERPLHMPQQIGNHFRRDAQLAVGKVLDEDGAEKRVIGRADTDGKGSTQTRSEVVEQDGPRPGRLPGGDQKAASTLQTGIVEVKERVLRGVIAIVDRDPKAAVDDQARHFLLAQIFSVDRNCRCTIGPEVKEMRLAAARRTMQHKRPRRPVRPPVDPADGRSITLRY